MSHFRLDNTGMVEALVFDFDGLILDTEYPIYQAWQECYEAHGRHLALEVYCECVGSDFGRFDPASHLEEAHGGDIDWDFWDEKREARVREIVNHLPPLPGVAERLAEARKAGLPCAVASSSPRSWVEPHLERLGLRHYFEFTKCRDDVVEPKPAPDLFSAAVEGLGVAPSRALVFEDSLNGLKASLAAGIPCVVVPNRVTGHLVFSGSVLRLGSFAEVSLAEIIILASGGPPNS